MGPPDRRYSTYTLHSVKFVAYSDLDFHRVPEVISELIIAAKKNLFLLTANYHYIYLEYLKYRFHKFYTSVLFI